MRILLARAGALGDLLLLRRSIFAARRAGHQVTLLAPAAGTVLVGSGSAEVDTHLPWDKRDAAVMMSGEHVPAGTFRAAVEACDLALAYTRSVELVHGLARLVPVTFAFDPAPPPAAGPASAWLARPMAMTGLDTSAAPPAHVPTAEETEAAQAWLERLPQGFLAIHPGSGSARKNWPFERFLALADALAPEAPWLLALGPAEERLLERPAHDPRAARVLAHAVTAREAPLRVLGALFAHAGLYAGNDSGATHLAAACGVPTLALFGPTDPQVWAPEGAHVTALRAPDAQLASLDVDTVVAAARRTG
jgi:ADP-heptose:LPS heptosyltransferase